MGTEDTVTPDAQIDLPIAGGEGVDDLVGGGEGEGLPVEPIEGAPVEGVEPTPFAPNFQFNVLEEQREFDERIRPLITDAESEAWARDLYERAYGIDVVKEDRQNLRTHNQQLDQTVNTYAQNYQNLGSMVQSKDYGSFLKQWGIAPEDMVDFAINHVRANDPNTPPEERQQYQQQAQTNQQMAHLQYQNQQLQSQLQGNTVQQTAIDLNMELARPEATQVAQDFDARVGQPGAFRQRVIDMGAQLSRHDPQTGQFSAPSAAEALQKTIQFMGYNPAAMGTPHQQAPLPGQAPVQQVQAPTTKPVIPTVQGSGTSPVKQQVRSIDQLRELAQAANS